MRCRYGSVKKMAQAASAAAAGKGAGTCACDSNAASTAGGEAPGGINVVYGEVTFPIRYNTGYAVSATMETIRLLSWTSE